MASILVSYDRFLEMRQRRHGDTDAAEHQPIKPPQASQDRPPVQKLGDPRVRVESSLVTHD
jgi:hypothetical protein